MNFSMKLVKYNNYYLHCNIWSSVQTNTKVILFLNFEVFLCWSFGRVSWSLKRNYLFSSIRFCITESNDNSYYSSYIHLVKYKSRTELFYVKSRLRQVRNCRKKLFISHIFMSFSINIGFFRKNVNTMSLLSWLYVVFYFRNVKRYYCCTKHTGSY